MSEFRGIPPGPNVGTQLKALRRKKARQKSSTETRDLGTGAEPLQALAAEPKVCANVSLKPLDSLAQVQVERWFSDNDRKPFSFQQEVWHAMLAGKSGLLHATTGAGKTLAVWIGALLRLATLPKPRGRATQVLWITPMRALAADTTQTLNTSLAGLQLDATVQKLTGDTPSAERTQIQKKPPMSLVTTPESLTLMLTRAHSVTSLSKISVVIVDEWHELVGNKRGVQLQLALARLVQLNPELQVWGLSATLGNLLEAMDTLLHPLKPDSERVLVQAKLPKRIRVDTLIPERFERFPWAGHLGLKQLPRVLDELEQSASTLVFTNTRSQAEIWYQAILEARPDWAGLIALHHGSLDKSVRDWVEQGLKQGLLKAVVCTSSLDLGVDFLPVERVLQIGSPKGVARLLQRAGRSGHAPGRESRVTVVPAHAMEMLESAAAQLAVARRQIESRQSPENPMDVLVQHLVTVAMGTGFQPERMFNEIRRTWAYRHLTEDAFNWALSFVQYGGDSLQAYPDYQRVVPDEEGIFRVPRRDIARRHAMSVGTIVSDSSMQVAWMRGGKLGTIEESFIARLKTGDVFSFAGRILELVKVRDMTAYVKKSSRKTGVVPQWQGGKMPLSSELAHVSLELLGQAANGHFEGPELQALQSLLSVQAHWSRLPAPGQLVIESMESKEGFHLFMYPFEGRTVHIGLASLLAWRASQHKAGTFSISMNDYGFELLSAEPVDWSVLLANSSSRQGLFSEQGLLEDLLDCLNASELAQRRFREIARISGLVFQGFPGAAKSTRQVQASSSLFFDVFKQYDPQNRLLDQAHREALEQELELERMRVALSIMRKSTVHLQYIERPTPFAFPLMIERLRETVSNESLSSRVAKMVAELEKQAQV